MRAGSKTIGRIAALAAAALLVIAGVCFACISAFTGKVSAECTSETLEAFLNAKHYVGEEVQLPSAQITEGDKTYETDAAVVFPGGTTYVTDNVEFTLSGRYTLIYTAKDAAQQKQYEYSFDVFDKYYTAGENSSVFCGTVQEGTGGQYAAGGKSGLVAEIAENETLNVNKLIDMNEISPDDTFLSISFLPYTMGRSDAQYIYITLTDAQDPTNVLTIEVRQADINVSATEHRSTFVMFYSSDQSPQGLETSDPARQRYNFMYEGLGYLRHINDAYGAKKWVSMSGAKDYNNTTATPVLDDTFVGTEDLDFRFDYAEKRIYVGDYLGIDLDDPDLVDNLWNGFSQDTCYISVSAGNYNQDQCRLLFNELAGLPLDSNDDLLDEEGPAIAVEDSDLLAAEYAVVGQPFPLPSATSIDSYFGECDVNLAVYTAYGTSSQARVTVTDGTFTPSQERTYTIEYSAKDGNGNITRKTYPVDAIETDARPVLSAQELPQTHTIGQILDLGAVTVENANGNYRVEIVCIHDGEEETIAQIDGTAEPADIEYRPMSGGEYTFVYRYSDYIFTQSEEVKVTVSSEGEAILLEDPSLPRYLIAGAQYDAPVLEGYTFENGSANAQAAALYVTETSDISSAQPVGDTFTASGTQMYFTYVLGGQRKQFSVPVIDVKYGTSDLEIYNYFTGENVQASPGDYNTDYTVGAGSDGGYSMEFINEVLTASFTLDVEIPENAAYTSVSLLLTDLYNPSVVLDITIAEISGSQILLSIGNWSITLDQPFKGGSFGFRYDGDDMTASIDGGANTYTVRTDAAGKTWNGFSAERAWLSLEFGGATGDCAVNISAVNNQPIGSGFTGDTFAPSTARPIITGYLRIGTQVVLDPFYAEDVLDPNTTVTMNVTLNGNAVTAADGTVLQNLTGAAVEKAYTLNLNEYGSYEVYYTYTDSQGNTGTYTYIIRVADAEAPEIVIGSHSDTARVGKAFTVADVTVTDNITPAEECQLYVYLRSPSGIYEQITGDTCTVYDAGEYQIWYLAIDAAGNVTFANYGLSIS